MAGTMPSGCCEKAHVVAPPHVPHHVVDGPLDIFVRQRDETPQPFENFSDVARVLANHNNAIILFIDGERDAVAIKDKPARRRE